MQIPVNIRLFRFYLWVGLGYFLLGFLHTLGNHPDRFFSVLFNNVWGVVYVIVLNFVLFEYTIPFILRKRKTIIYNVLLGILLLWVQLMFYSYGSYLWRLLGIQLHVYTALTEFSSLGKA